MRKQNGAPCPHSSRPGGVAAVSSKLRRQQTVHKIRVHAHTSNESGCAHTVVRPSTVAFVSAGSQQLSPTGKTKSAHQLSGLSPQSCLQMACSQLPVQHTPMPPNCSTYTHICVHASLQYYPAVKLVNTQPVASCLTDGPPQSSCHTARCRPVQPRQQTTPCPRTTRRLSCHPSAAQAVLAAC